MSDKNQKTTEANIIKTLIEELSKNSEFVDTIKNLERLIISLAPSIVKKITGNIITKEIANLLPIAKKEKKTRKDKKVDWTKVKEVGLRQAHSYRNKKGMPIEDELNEELARRFPGYDKGTKTFGHNKKVSIDWSKLKDVGLRQAYLYRKKKNLIIEDELNEELACRFPGYNKKTKTFGHNKKVSIDWSKQKDTSLRTLHNNLKKRGLPIEYGLNEELARRFPGYDKVTKTFGHNNNISKKISTDWTKLKDVNLRQAYLYRKKKNLIIEDELNEELARRFPGYDKVTKTFGHAATDKKSKTPKINKTSQQENNKNIVESTTLRSIDKEDKSKIQSSNLKLPLFSCLTNTNKYSLYFDNGNNTVNLLKASKAPYELCLFDEKIQMAIIRKKTDINSYLLYVVDLKKGKIFSSFKQGVKIIRYNAKTHEIFVAAEKAYSYTIISRDSTTHKYMNIPTYAETIKADSLQKNTILVNKDGKETTCPVIKIAEQKDLGTQNQKIETFLISTSSEKVSTVNNTTTTLETPKEEEPAKEEISTTDIPVPNEQANTITPEINYGATEIKYQDLVVSVKQLKITLSGIYNDVFVNDKKILSNHVNTQIKLFGDDTILAIHGIITNNSDYPVTPQWMVYDANLNSRAPKIKQVFSKYNVQIKNVILAGDSIRLDLTNRSSCLLNIERMKKIAGNKRFVIKTEKTK